MDGDGVGLTPHPFAIARAIAAVACWGC